MRLSDLVLATLRSDGWAYFRAPAGQPLPSVVLRLAQQLGSPVSSRGRPDLVDRLVPLTREHAHPASMSSKYGQGALPLHVDTSHWPEPARYLVFACENPGESSRATSICPAQRLELGLSERRLLQRGIHLISNAKKSYYCSILASGRDFIRFDPGCMSAATRDGQEAWKLLSERLKAAVATSISWSLGDVLVIDNWRVFHGREDATGDDGRSLLRVLVKERS